MSPSGCLSGRLDVAVSPPPTPRGVFRGVKVVWALLFPVDAVKASTSRCPPPLLPPPLDPLLVLASLPLCLTGPPGSNTCFCHWQGERVDRRLGQLEAG